MAHGASGIGTGASRDETASVAGRPPFHVDGPVAHLSPPADAKSLVPSPDAPRFPIDADLLRVPAGPGTLSVARFGLGGDPVVLLHGFGTCNFLWRTVGPLIAEGGHIALAIDLMGYGESDRPLEGDYSVAAQTDYVEAALTALRIPRATIVGVDIGGGVAVRLAAMYPARVSRLMLVNSVAFDDWPGGDVKIVQRGSARFALRVARGLLGATALLRPVLEGSVANAENMPPRLVARYLAPFVGPDGVAHLLTLASALRADDVAELDLRSLHVPTLIVWGEEDKWLDPHLPERMVVAISGSRLVRLPSVGRLVPEEAPDVLSSLLLEFVDARDRSGEDTA